jgi:hypothetical protein
MHAWSELTKKRSEGSLTEAGPGVTCSASGGGPTHVDIKVRVAHRTLTRHLPASLSPASSQPRLARPLDRTRTAGAAADADADADVAAAAAAAALRAAVAAVARLLGSPLDTPALPLAARTIKCNGHRVR